MKHPSKFNLLLPLLSAGLGLAAAVLRAGLYAAALDEKNLLVSFHPLSILTWVVCAAALGLLVPRILTLNGSNRWEDNFRSSIPAAIGCFLLAAAIALVQLPMLAGAVSLLEKVRNLTGLVSIAAMAWVGFCRLRGSKPFFGCHSILCVYLSVYLVTQYRIWSSNPQLQDYVFSMLACVCMTLFAYQQAAFDADAGSRRSMLLFGLPGSFFAMAALWGEDHAVLYAAGAVWMMANLCSLTPVSRYLAGDGSES